MDFWQTWCLSILYFQYFSFRFTLFEWKGMFSFEKNVFDFVNIWELFGIEKFRHIVLKLPCSVLNIFRVVVGLIDKEEWSGFWEFRKKMFDSIIFKEFLMNAFQSFIPEEDLIWVVEALVDNGSCVYDIIFLMEVVIDGDGVSLAIIDQLISH